MFANMKRFLICWLILTINIACSDVSFEDFAREEAVVLEQEEPIKDNEPQFKNEEFTQGSIIKPIDILFIVDNSPSMIEEQEEIGKRIESFLDEIKNLDWQIGVTTTDVSNGNFGLKGDLLQFENHHSNKINKDDADFKEKFLKTVKREESSCYSDCASSDEQPLLASIYSMHKQLSQNKHFFRDNADLAIVILSDEDEMSDGPYYATQPQEVIDTVQLIWGGKKNFRAYGIIIKPGDSRCLRENRSGHYGSHVAELARLTGGVTGSICSDNYGSSLKQIGESVRHLTQTIQLKKEPEPTSIQIVFVPSFKTSWTMHDKEIHFSTPPPEGTKISIQYIPKKSID